MSDCYTQTVNEVYYNFKLITSATLAHGLSMLLLKLWTYSRHPPLTRLTHSTLWTLFIPTGIEF